MFDTLKNWPVGIDKGLMFTTLAAGGAGFSALEPEIWIKIQPNAWISSYTLGTWSDKELSDYSEEHGYTMPIRVEISNLNNWLAID